MISTRWAVENGDFARSLNLPGVDGALVELDWSQVEPQRGIRRNSAAINWELLQNAALQLPSRIIVGHLQPGRP